MGSMREVSVDVELELSHTPPFNFQSSLPSNGNNHLKFKNGKKDGFLISYNLVDPGNTYTFGSDLNKALWSTSKAECPTSEGQWEQFTAYAIINNGMTLQVWNKNRTAQDFGYTLRITDDSGATYMNLDPIGTNQNTNSRTGIGGGTIAATIAGGVVGYIAVEAAMPAVTTMSAALGAIIGAVVGFGLAQVFQGIGAQAV